LIQFRQLSILGKEGKVKSRSYLKYVCSFLKWLPLNSGDNIRQGRHIRKSPISLENDALISFPSDSLLCVDIFTFDAFFLYDACLLFLLARFSASWLSSPPPIPSFF